MLREPLSALPRRVQIHPGQASCERCGTPLAPKRTGRRPRFCSDACRKATFRALTPASRHDGQGPANGNRIIRAELIDSDTAIALGHAVKAYTPVPCRALVAAGHDPALRLEAYRNETHCLTVRSIGEGSRLEINARGNGFRVHRAADAAPPVAANGLDLFGPRPGTEEAPEPPVAQGHNGAAR
jgi:hypothetical protein